MTDRLHMVVTRPDHGRDVAINDIEVTVEDHAKSLHLIHKEPR